MSDLDVVSTDDPHYLRKEVHVISSRGLYCPFEEAFFDPPVGLQSGDNCPLCDEVVRV